MDITELKKILDQRSEDEKRSINEKISGVISSSEEQESHPSSTDSPQEPG